MSKAAGAKKRSLEEIKTRVLRHVWDAEPSDLTRFWRLLYSLVKISFLVARDFIENLVKLQAMALAFKTLLSLAPLLAVVFAVLKGLGVHNRLEPVLAEALAPLGDKGHEITVYLIAFVDRMKAGALGTVGMVTLFITVISLMGTIEQALNHVWRVKSPRNLTRKFSDYLSVILVGPILVFAAMTITATLQNNDFVQRLMSLEPLGTLALVLLRLVPYLTLWGAFTFFYVFVPNTRVKLKSALIGGLAAAVLWQTVGWGFAVFVASSTRYYVIYSSFAILLLFLLWLYIGWVIVLLGAQVAFAYQNAGFYHRNRQDTANTPGGREKFGLQAIYLVGRNFYYGHDPMSISDLSTRLSLPASLVNDIMETFQRARLVLRLADEETYVLGRDPETISVKQILDCIKNGGGVKKDALDRAGEEHGIDELLMEVDESVADALEGKSLQSLILSLSPKSARR